MRHDKLERELQLMLLMTENRNYTVEELCSRIGISQRNLYYYIDFFRDCGFDVEKSGKCYRLNRNSTFFKKLFDAVNFTEDEIILIRRLLDGADGNSVVVRGLKNKLDKFYDFDILGNVATKEYIAHNVSVLYEAIKYKQLAIIKGYSSPHSKTKSDRTVEPFMFMNNNNEVRCFELSSGENKTFKVARMEDVVLIDLSWENEERHKQMYTDIFMFSAEQQERIILRLGRLSYNLITEEYPASIRYITQDKEDSWILDINVCNYAGIGRFVIGLSDDIEIIEGYGLKDYIRNKVNNIKNNIDL